MVPLDFHHRPPLPCNDRLRPTPAPPRERTLKQESTLKRQPSLSAAAWAVIAPAARILKGSTVLVNSTVHGLHNGLTEEGTAVEAAQKERRQILSLRLKDATTREEWQVTARELDILEDNEAWKFDNISSDFDATLIEARLRQLDDARLNCDIKQMMLLVRTALSRDLGGMGNIKLYKHTHIGTKDLIERYIDSTLATIRSLVDTTSYTLPDGLETKDVLEQVVYARQSFGRSALLLSGGGTFGMNHIGVLKALAEVRLLPRIISGASAGSIVSSVICTRTDEEIPELMKSFPYGDLAVFEEDGREDTILERVQRLLTEGSWIDSKHLSRVMYELMGDMTFQDAYNRTRKILNITVSSASAYELPRLLNYITSPNVIIWSAVAASCSVPILFSAASLLVKDPATGQRASWNPNPQRWIDGSVDNDLPMTRLAEMFNVNHFIVSQVNPHVVPFLVKDEEEITKEAQLDAGPGWLYTLTNLAKGEALHRLQVLADLGVLPNLVTKASSILSQKYSGDITILPAIEFKKFPLILKNPTQTFMTEALLCGERATWPKLSRIRNHCAVELELDTAVQALRARVVFSPSQVDLRRMSTGATLGLVKRRSGRQREGSACHINARDEDEVIRKSRSSISRANHKTQGTSQWSAMKGPLPPVETSMAKGTRSAHGTPLTSPQPEMFRSFKFPKDALRLSPRFTDQSSAGETTHSSPSSDADIDTHTDDSSPEPFDVSGLGLYYVPPLGQPDQPIDFFSATQPVTARTDHVLATSPSTSIKANISATITPSTTPRSGSQYRNLTEPSSPEKRYKMLFHPPQDKLEVPR